MADDFCLVHDDLLGYAPKPGFRGVGAGGWAVTIDSDGLRTCGVPAIADLDRAILAVGDSYTFGEEVSDAETWPALLQRLSARRVLNGGVSGYGFDQIVLRAEQLADQHKPSMIIVGFIADDIRRTELRRLWGRNKPWFTIELEKLVLKGAPVPERKPLSPSRLRHRLERILIELPAPLQQFCGYHVRRHPAGHGTRIALHLVERLAELEEKHQCRVVLLAQYHPHVWVDRKFATEERRAVQGVLDRASSLGLAIVDTFPRFAIEPTAASFYVNSHLSARGNSMIASLLAARLPELQERRTSSRRLPAGSRP
jgi:GDSL-like Lipase/Acylhydrolase.